MTPSPRSWELVSELPTQAADELFRRLRAHQGRPELAEFGASLFRWPSQPNATHSTSLDWVAFPERVGACVGRGRALHVLDILDDVIGGGGRSLQEEYAEWRVGRGSHGIQRVEVTSETSDYWRLLAAYAPKRVIDLVADFASEDEPDVSLIYGALDPFAPGVTPSSREAAFAEMMLSGGRSPYNNGARAILCMVHPSNSMTALLSLAIASSTPFDVIDVNDGRLRCATCIELALRLKSAAQLGRASDPLIVERLARLAFEGRLITLDAPGPLTISGVENSRLRTPSRESVPLEWFQFSRPTRPGATQEKRYQRVSLEIPKEEGFCVSDLTDAATEEPIKTGAQVADLVQISLHLLTSEASNVDRVSIDISHGADDLLGCEDIRRRVQDLED
jgi:hypothetical protein